MEHFYYNSFCFLSFWMEAQKNTEYLDMDIGINWEYLQQITQRGIQEY